MDGEVTIKTSLDTKSFDAQISKIEDDLDTLEQEYANLKKVEPVDSEILKEYANNIEKTKNKLIELNKKQLELNKTPKVGAGISEAISNNVKKMGKWVLAIFSVRSAYSLVRSAVSTLAGENEKLANKINFIKTSLANVLTPVVNWLVNQAYKLVYYIAYILNAWFKIDILAKNTSKNLNKSDKSAKSLRKTLAGFDEMNILQDNVTGAKTDNPFEKLEKVEIPDWIKKIGDNKDKILRFLTEVGILLVGLKIGSLVSNLSALSGLKGGLTGVAIALGIIATVQLYKIIKEAKSLHDELKALVDMTKKSSENFKENTEEMEKNYKQGKYNERQEKLYTDMLFKRIETNQGINKGIEEQSTLMQILTGSYSKNKEIMKLNNEEIQYSIDKLNVLYENGKLNNEQTEKYSSLLEIQISNLRKQNQSLDVNSEKYKENSKKIQEMRTEFEKINGTKYTAKLEIDADDKPAKSKVSSFLKTMGNSLFSTFFPSLNFANTLKKFKFAKGGIINLPGRGVPISQSVGGERGQEGIIPLTDSQQMELLGRAIGKYTTINATIINQMNGRVISREIKKINTDNDFATNN